MLHAQRAADLPLVEWIGPEGSEREFLIDDSNVRNFYGPVIGRIARSHNDPVSEIESVGQLLGAFEKAPSDWTVDPVKIASLLRTADAAHIDQRRAPRFLRAVLSPSQLSDRHWTFQGKLAKPRLQVDALAYSSGPDFTLAEADSWWLCFDTIRMIDRELQGVDSLLLNSERERFAARRVLGAESPSALAEHVRTSGWNPVDAKLKVSDVPHLVQLLGGVHLYGEDSRVPIRELIQNSTDAVRARRLLDPGFGDRGYVLVRLLEKQGNTWLEVEDNGIGMSQRTLTDSLLDFGRSFWNTDSVRQEFPGLLAKGMSSTGRFGIGFYSVFMLGQEVHVASKRYDSSLDSTDVLEFRGGLELRPILRGATAQEFIHDGGTRVLVRLDESILSKEGYFARSGWIGKRHKLDLVRLVPKICPSIDVNVQVEHGDRRKDPVLADDWKKVSGRKLLRRLAEPNVSARQVEVYGELIRPLKDGTRDIVKCCGRGGSGGALFDQFSILEFLSF